MSARTPVGRPTLGDIRAAQERIAGLAVRTPLLRLRAEDIAGVAGGVSGAGRPAEIYLKLENLQPIGSFKIRGAGNALRLAPRETLARGVTTASAGNMAQGVAWVARELGVPCAVVVPEKAPTTKLDAVARMGARIIKAPFDAWWRALEEHQFPGLEGLFVHPVSEPAVIAGNGTIGLEIYEDLPHVDTVLVPFGGGGLSSGIAAALAELAPRVKVYACEVETAAPFAASLAAGKPTTVAHTASFVDGISSKTVLPEMWPLASGLLAGSIVVSLDEVAAAVRLLAERTRVIAEGAGAVAVAAALSGRAGGGTIACVVSGGNIDTRVLAEILQGRTPATK